ncbi:MAG: glycoside hydrolase family 3 protein [Acidobacteria bacterium]|nr:glycoside hydrolase family 3 protein [Acidobacteriota bacterium]
MLDQVRNAISLTDTSALAGECLVVGFNGTALVRGAAEALSDVRPAGVILFSRNLQQRSQIRDLMQQISEQCAPRLVCVDQEGGRVDRLRGVFPCFPAAPQLAKAEDGRLLYECGQFTGEVLRAFGFNVNLAPVLDLHFHDDDNALQNRYWGEDPQTVADLAGHYLRGMQRGGVAGCGKHFPGLGRARLDTHFRLSQVDASLEQLATDLIPYQRMQGELALVMVNHARYPGLEAPPFSPAPARGAGLGVPASCSPAVYQLLRNALGFTGIAITDDLEMGAIRDAVSYEEIPVLSFQAGADLLLIGSSLDFARHSRDCLARLLEQPCWRQRALLGLEKLRRLPPIVAADLERVAELEKEFTAWKRSAGLD